MQNPLKQQAYKKDAEAAAKAGSLSKVIAESEAGDPVDDEVGNARFSVDDPSWTVESYGLRPAWALLGDSAFWFSDEKYILYQSAIIVDVNIPVTNGFPHVRFFDDRCSVFVTVCGVLTTYNRHSAAFLLSCKNDNVTYTAAENTQARKPRTRRSAAEQMKQNECSKIIEHT